MKRLERGTRPPRKTPRALRRAGRAPAALSLLALIAGCASTATGSKDAAKIPEPFAETLADAEARAGLLTFHVDPKEGRVWLELPATESEPESGPESDGATGPADASSEGVVGEFLYVEGLLTGLGSNPIGLDRGQLGPSRLVVLRRLGGRLLVEAVNLGYRALSDDPRERNATRESFASSVLWAGKIAEEGPDGRALVDFTSFLVRDAHGVSRRLAATGQGSYRLDPERSAVDLSACLAFPDNLEFEALLTYVSDSPGPLVSQTAPLGEAFGLVQHHSLIRLPEEGYRPRRFDPRAGSFAISFQDYAAPLDETIETRWIVRHRLSRTGPDSELVYYVDSGAPEPIRSALVEGANWWAEAFEAAGYPGAFRVEVLPEGVHPLDVRYNVIQWVHRSTRGWSYGGGVIDPRTGEMIKGHVSLGSLRVRQDRLIFEGLLGTGKTGTGAADDPIELALARIRQLSAHEVGHTLGLAHNFAASTYGRASVMDYPAPWVRVTESGELDVSEAYGVGVGAWDVHATRFAYTEFPDEASEAAGLEALVHEGAERGLIFLSDSDARPPGAAEPRASLWDNGSDAADQLLEELAVRRLALERFGRGNVTSGTPLALLEEVLATVYFRHRYQLEAAVKMVGGLEYGYGLAGDEDGGVRPLAAEEQRRALEAVLSALSAEALDLPETVLELLAPRPFGYSPNRELFEHRTAPAFDALGAAETAADLVVRGLLQPERAARLVDLARRHEDLPGFDEVLDRLLEAGFGSGSGEEQPARRAEIRRAVQGVITGRLIELASNDAAPLSVRGRAEAGLRRILDLSSKPEPAEPEGAEEHAAILSSTISRFLERSATAVVEPPPVPPIPPGSPIGSPQASESTSAWVAPNLGACSMAHDPPAEIQGGIR